MADNSAFSEFKFSSEPVSTKKENNENASINHPFLAYFSSYAVRAFLKLYERYATLVTEYARQVNSLDTAGTKPCRSESLKFRINVELLESGIDLGFIGGVEFY